VNLLTL